MYCEIFGVSCSYNEPSDEVNFNFISKLHESRNQNTCSSLKYTLFMMWNWSWLFLFSFQGCKCWQLYIHSRNLLWPHRCSWEFLHSTLPCWYSTLGTHHLDGSGSLCDSRSQPGLYLSPPFPDTKEEDVRC